jgi:hypothetical protein|tara:strand:- start:53 stop:628 length:576 start_codon:yes stop_codon:yes gene_type:complete
MKDLQFKDILVRQDLPLTRASVYVNGRWSFASLAGPTRVTSEQDFFLINYPFGINKTGTKDPSRYTVKGAPGDYISRDQRGVLALVTASHYALLFPGPQQIPTSPPSSDQLKNPNFLTKTQAESVENDSDKVLIGDREFTLPSTQNKTITIVETPTGQAQVYFTGDTGVVYDYDLSGMVEVSLPSKPTSDY